MTEKRFTEEEAAAIFERAAHTEVAVTHRGSSEGMTLPELQEAGREAGLAPELIARAAAELESIPASTGRRFGLPVRVGHDVALSRPLTEAEWEQLVVDCRRTFDAEGVLRQDGSFREWSNGNLHVLLEPDGRGGQRLGFRTTNGTAKELIDSGAFMGGLGGVSLIVWAITSALNLSASPVFGVTAAACVGLGGVFFGLGALPLRRWGALRQTQMKEIAARVERTFPAPMTSAPPSDPPA